MSDSRWTMQWSFGGETWTENVYDVVMNGEASLWTPRISTTTATVTWSPQLDLPALVAKGPRPQNATATLYYGDQQILIGRWSEPEFGPHGMESRVRVGETLGEDGGTLPPRGQIWRRYSGDEVIDLVGGKDDFLANPAQWGIDVLYYAGAARVAQGRFYPFVWGAPGSTEHPGSPALLSDVTSMAEELIINGGATNYATVSSTTVTIWGPDTNDDLTSDAGITVFFKNDPTGRLVTYVQGPDLTNVVLKPGSEYYVSWTNGIAQPEGAGDLLLQLYQSSTLPVDTLAWASVRERLNRYKMAGYIDDECVPSRLAEEIIRTLPISAEMGPRGIRPILWPWLDDPSTISARTHLIDGRNCHLASPMSFSTTALNSVFIQYAWDPESGTYSKSYTASSGNNAYGRVGRSRVPRPHVRGGTEDMTKIQTRWVWDEATAQAMAQARLRALAIPRRVFSVMVDRDLYGFGGSIVELRPGMPVLVTCSRFSIASELAHVSAVEWRVDQVRVELTMRDDALLD